MTTAMKRAATRWVVKGSSPRDPSAPRILIEQHALERMINVSERTLDSEVGGFFLGTYWRASPAGPFHVSISQVIPARHTIATPSSLNFTPETWVSFSVAREAYPNLYVVGWFHTHPRMDVFLSSYDVFIHTNFYVEPWQVAAVVEPETCRLGFFTWRHRRFEHANYTGFLELGTEPLRKWSNLRAAGRVRVDYCSPLTGELRS